MCALADQISFTLIEKPQRYCNIGDLFRKLHLRSWSGAIDSLVMYFGVNLRNLWVLFVVPACHLLALDRFDWHHQASVRCSKQGCQEISATSNYFFRDSQKNFWDCGESNLGPLGGKCECYPLCYAAPPPPICECFFAAGMSCQLAVSVNVKVLLMWLHLLSSLNMYCILGPFNWSGRHLDWGLT